jgi:DNA-binding beta-propeller fold protein YncE
MNSGQARALLAQTGAALVVSALIVGCGNNYRPVVTPINPNGPPAQPTSYAVVVSNTGAASDGIATIIDYSGDTIMAEAPIGPGPLAFTIDELGANGYTLNSDGTLTNFPITTNLQAKNILQSTLPHTALPVNLMAPSSGLWATDLNGDVADIFSGSPQTFQRAVAVGTTTSPATMPMYIVGAPTLTGQREYVLSQNVPDSAPMTCNTSPTGAPPGVVTPIEITSFATDAQIQVGRCPVYGLLSPDQKRMFVLNRGDDTVSVINAQDGTLDNQCPTGCVNQNGQTYYTHPTLPLSLTAVNHTGITPPGGGTTGMSSVAGPVHAEYNAATTQLVVADYDGNTISVIDVSLDEYGNDSSTFGTTFTIPVGANPAAVTVLYDGTRAYTANQTDGTVTIVNLSSHTVEKTLAVVGNPRTVVSTENSLYGKVYVAAPNTPYLTLINTETDLIDTTVLVEGNVVDVRVTTQNGSSGSNVNYASRVPGYGQPCNLPGVPTPTGTQTPLEACQAIP